MVEILALVLQHDEQAVLAAVELALEAGAPTKTHILNLLHRLVDGNPIDPPAVKPPRPDAHRRTASQRRAIRRLCAKWRRAMRHNPAAGAVVIRARAVSNARDGPSRRRVDRARLPAFEAAVPIRSQLLKAEMADKEVRSTPYRLKAARFPNYRDLAGFDFASSEVNEALARQFHGCEFLEDAHNVVLVGGPGTGKTHLATAIGVQAIEHHRKRVRFFSTVERVNALEQEKLQGKPGQIAARLTHSDLVILDEPGYLPFSASGGALLFHLLIL